MSSAQCPQCAGPVTTGSDKFCTSCGSALSWVEQPAEAAGGITGSATTSGASFACPACREPNPASRLLCQRCGALLQPAQAPLPASLAPGASWRWRAPLILLAIAAVGAAVAAVLGASLRSDGRLSPSAPSAATTARAAAASAPVQVDPRSISASASSELPPAHEVTYSIGNTLDGNTRTAWNNHSAVDGSGVGETLTYRFSSRVHLVRIDLVNGYAKTAELRADNGRIRGVVILTDRRTLRATLSDTASRQRLDRDFGLTRKVTLRVTSIYPGARYTDLALTEIAFWAVPS
jgi:Nicotine adenine dinucleotide glycohydrolase (NADase)/Double zinc ribbon